MLHCTLILEDTFLVANRDTIRTESPDEQVTFESKWVGFCCNMFTDKTVKFCWSDEQLAAVMSLAIGGDGPPNVYAVAEAAIESWPSEIRPIP